MKKFKPQLFPNEKTKISDIKYHMLSSYKLDGIRCVIHKDYDVLVSRELKVIANKQLQEKFKPLIDAVKISNGIIEGELYSHELTFQEITRAVMTDDLFDNKKIKQYMKEFDIEEAEACLYAKSLIDKIEFHCFNCIWSDNYDEIFSSRICNASITKFEKFSWFKRVEFISLRPEDIEKEFLRALELGYEGLMLINPESKYKCGRITYLSGDGYKFKPFEDFDAKIIAVTQRTKAKEGSKKTINKLGHSRTSQKKDDRENIEMASSFVVDYNGFEVEPTIALPDKEKIEIWKNRDKYIGRYIEYTGMLVGSKDKPRHPVFKRFREDRD